MGRSQGFRKGWAELVRVGFCRGLSTLVGWGLAGLMLAQSAWAKPQRVPGTPIQLDPPPGFQVAPNFSGFIDPNTGSSILVNSLPAPTEALLAGFTPENLAQRNLQLVSREVVTVDGRTAHLFGLTQQVGELTVPKWILVRNEGAATTMIVANLIQESPARTEAVKQMLLAATWRLDPARLGTQAESSTSTQGNPDLSEVTSSDATSPKTENLQDDPQAGLGFRLAPSDRLKIAFAAGGAVVLTEDGAPQAASPEQPLLVVASSLRPVELDDLAGFARQRASQTTQIKNLGNLQGRSLQISGLSAYELTGDALDQQSHHPLRFYQTVIVTAPDAYILVQGFVGAQDPQNYLSEFRRLTTTLTPNPRESP